MGLKQNFKNTSWLVLGRVVKLGLTFLVGVFVARYLGPEQYGLYNFTISFVMLFMVVSRLGLNHLMIREFSESPDKSGVYLGTCAALKIVAALISFSGIIGLSFLLNIDSDGRILIFIFGLSLIFRGFDIITVYLESLRQARVFIIAELIQAVCFAIAKIWCIYTGKPVLWFIAVQASEWILILSIVYAVLRKRDVDFFKTWSFSFGVAKTLLKEAYPFIFAGAAVIIYRRIDQIMLHQMVSSEEVGFYAAATRPAVFIGLVPTLVVRSLTPSLVGAKKKSEKLFRQRYQLLDSLIFWGTLAVTLGVVLFSGLLISILYGDSYTKSSEILSVLAWKGLFTAMGAASAQYILVSGLQKYVPIRQGAGCILNIAMNVCLIPVYGAVGAAWASVLATMVALFGMHFFIPTLRELFYCQCKSIMWGWLNLIKFAKNGEHDES